MSIAGNLNTMQLAELLQWLSNGMKTGTLVLDNGVVEKQIFFRNGRVCSTSSSDPKEYLGHFLVSHGLISEMELSKAIEMQQSNKLLLGKILVTIGAVSEPDLQRILRLKAEESIYQIFSWREAEFRFRDGEGLADELIPIDMDVAALVFEGARRADEWEEVRKVIPTLEAIPVTVGAIQLARDDPGAMQILSLINDDLTVEEICLQTHSSEFRVCKLLYDQARAGKIKLIIPRWSRKREAEPPPPAADPGPVGADSLLRLALKHLDDKNYEQALRHLRAARSLEPDDRRILGVVEQGEDRIRKAMAEAGLVTSSTPQLNVDIQELTELNITPQQGFILTRINGTYDLDSILKISPIHQLDGLLVFYRLLSAGYIRLE
jgi:hypothetical protein